MSIEIKKVYSLQFTVYSFFLILFTFHFSLFTAGYASEPPRYEINAYLDTVNYKITARQKVIFTNNSDKELDAIYFHIYPHRKYTEKEIRFIYRYAAYFEISPFPEGFQSGDLKIESISSDIQPLNYVIEGEDQTILKVSFDSTLRPGEYKEIDIDFQVDIPRAYGRFGWHKDIITLTRWYPILSVLDKEGWHNYPFYIYHQPYMSEAAYYKVKLTVPHNENVASSGSLKKETLNSDGTKTLNLETEFPVRDFSLGVSKSFLVYLIDEGKIKIKSYYLRGDEKRAKEAAERALDLMKFYSQHFIEYPYSEFNIVPSYLGFGGMQSSCLVFIDTRVYKLPGFLQRYFDFLIAHETGHQWFYNIVGSDEYKEMFIDEGFNSYWLLKYLKNKYGQDVETMVLPKALQWLIPNFSFERAQLDRYSFIAKSGIDSPVLGELSSFTEPSSIFSIAYGKGSKVVDMLNYVMGDDAFGKLMHRFFNEFKFKNISVSDLKTIASQETNTDLNWFFDDWLNTTKKCDYAIKDVREHKIIVENRGDIPMPVELEVELEDGNKVGYFWDGAAKNKEFLVDKTRRIKSVQLDPQRRLLDLDRTNNHYRRRIDVRPVILYYFIYEVPVFLKDDAYSFVIGPDVGESDFGIKFSFQKPQDNLLYISSAYNFNEERIKNTFGFEQRHLLGKLLKGGIELFDYNDINGSDDQQGFKLYLRQELWPVSYGLLDENDHVTVYLLRDRDFKSALTSGGLEDVRNLYYRQQDESILGINLKVGRYGTYPDPAYGWKFISTLENAEHILGGENYFWRFSPELTRYFNLTPQQKLAGRIKLGLGYPADKGLFQLGGEKGIRGYGYKTINGSQAVMFNIEYRKDLIDNLDLRFLDNLISLDKIQAVGFFDMGKAWFRSFNDRSFKKDLGLGLRLHFTLSSFLEKFILRLDIAQALNEPKEDARLWLGISHTF